MSNVAYKSNLEPKRVHNEEIEEQKQLLVKRKKITTGEKNYYGHCGSGFSSCGLSNH